MWRNTISPYQLDELIVDVLHHYRVNGMPPKVEASSRLTSTILLRAGLIIEGSALWPELVATLVTATTYAALWLTASEAVFRQKCIRDC